MSPTPHSHPARAWPSRWIAAFALVLGRSLFPFLSLAIIAGTLLWGPWVSLFLALCAWRLVVRYA